MNCAILSARNIDVNEINEKFVNFLVKIKEKVYTSIDSIGNCDNEGFDGVLLPEDSITHLPLSKSHELRWRLN